ncbi:MAG: hypothetical protein LBK99_26580, partial [Opitutaceae bacterium]|nr:hypothetical protein [Opitutaceae bacterium]
RTTTRTPPIFSVRMKKTTNAPQRDPRLRNPSPRIRNRIHAAGFGDAKKIPRDEIAKIARED